MHSQLLSALNAEKVLRKAAQAQLKKVKREYTRVSTSLRSEIELTRKSIQKNQQNESKSRQRIQSLMETTKQLDNSIKKLETLLEETKAERRSCSEESNQLARDLTSIKESLRRMERKNAREMSTQSNTLSNLDRDLAILTSNLSAKGSDLFKLENEEHQSLLRDLNDLDRRLAAALRRQKDAQSAVSAADLREHEYLNGRKKELEAFVEACENATRRNEGLKETLKEEKKFKDRLYDELKRVLEESFDNGSQDLVVTSN